MMGKQLKLKMFIWHISYHVNILGMLILGRVPTAIILKISLKRVYSTGDFL